MYITYCHYKGPCFNDDLATGHPGRTKAWLLMKVQDQGLIF